MDDKNKSYKQKEFEREIRSVLTEDLAQNDKFIEGIVKGFSTIKPPEIKSPEINQKMKWMSMSSPIEINSVKSGNIVLNWRKLFRAIPEIIMTAEGAKSASWLIPFAALHIWNSVWSLLKIELSEDHAIVFYVMWTNHDPNRKIEERKAFELTNKFLDEENRNQFNLEKYTQLANELVRLKCIEITDGVILLREWVRKKYK